jgi:hypothetical protein
MKRLLITALSLALGIYGYAAGTISGTVTDAQGNQYTYSSALTPVAVACIGDPGFELQTQSHPLAAPWVLVGPANANAGTTTAQYAHSGNRVGYVYATSAQVFTSIQQTINVAANTSYTVKFWTKCDSGGTPAGSLIKVTSAGGTVLGSTSLSVTSTYTQVSVTFNSGSNTSVIIVTGFTPSGVGVFQDMFMDDFTIT